MDSQPTTELVKQRHERDCFLCCLVMLTGLTYEAAAEKWGAEFVAMVAESGVYGSRSINHAMQSLGLERDRDYITPDVSPYSGLYIRNLLWGRRALVQVPSKNNACESHIVYWDGAELFDPSTKLTYTWLEVQPQGVWIFNERSR